jgi:hypothetical protein
MPQQGVLTRHFRFSGLGTLEEWQESSAQKKPSYSTCHPEPQHKATARSIHNLECEGEGTAPPLSMGNTISSLLCGSSHALVFEGILGHANSDFSGYICPIQTNCPALRSFVRDHAFQVCLFYQLSPLEKRDDE